MRRSGRIPKEIPIVLIGSDLAGRIFSEQTKTVLLSLHGAGLISKHKLSPEQELVLRWPERNKETEIRVVGQIGADSGVYTYGVAFFDHVENFWEIEFPPPSARDQEFGVLYLVCNVCQSTEKVDEASIEADVVATNDGVLRYCKRCGSSTGWKIAQPGASSPAASPTVSAAASQPQTSEPLATTPRPTLPPTLPPPSSPTHATVYSAVAPTDLIIGGLPAPASPAAFTSPPRRPPVSESARAPSPSQTASVATLPPPVENPAASSQKSGAPPVNRRRYPRIKVNYLALVRHAERGEEFVQCEDVSRGGLRFKSTSKYMEQTLIEVAAPYSSGQPAIFVAARIVYVQELPEQNLFRYGVEYLNTPKQREHA